ncbi:MAG: family 20 glycosylhydrolase [Gemmatimonadaceae bacterium]
MKRLLVLAFATTVQPIARPAGAQAVRDGSVMEAPASVSVIPAPVSVVRGAGAWAPAREVAVTLSGGGDDLRSLGAHAVAIAREALGATTSGVTSFGAGSRDRARGGIHLTLDPTAGGAPEGYRLVIDPGGAVITAPRPAGIFYGLQTLRQVALASPATGGRVTRIDAVTIDDAPRFAYRGLHLDVGRHFQSVDFIKRYIDLMSRFKLNTFHWHLTEDQGWRIEIEKYPRLTSVGGCRDETMVAKEFDPYRGDGTPHCGFYTQREIREVVAYARDRHVTVIPEIEMPGHSVAALAAYPELACTPGPFKVRTTWGVDENIFCPSELTFAFIEDVLAEVIALFPSRYIHIGGDEAPKDRWKASAVAQEVIRREGLKDEQELQSHFIRRIERFLVRHDRRLIGWDEILEGGLAPEATVMSWRGTSGGIEAARQAHDVIMSPTSHLYLDYYQGDPRFEPLANGGLVTLRQVYDFEPIPGELTDAEGAHVLGAQGNVWTEYLKTPAAVEYMAYPRALALAEVTWSPRDRRDWDGFVDRLPVALAMLDSLGVNYRLPGVGGLDGDVLTLEPTVRVRLRTALRGAEVRYTVDGSDPTRASERYTAEFALPVTEAGVRVTARAFTPAGKASPPRAATFRRTVHRAADMVDEDALAPGLRYEYFEADLRRVSGIDSLTRARSGVVDSVARRGDERPERYALRLEGYLRVPADGMYEFGLSSDDGSTLGIGDRVVVDNDGLHGTSETTGMVALRAGLHPLMVRFFQAGGGAGLSVRYRKAGGEWGPVPESWFAHRLDRP